MQNTAEYLREYIDDAITFEDWNGDAKKRLSLYLCGAFDFYLVTLLGEKLLFVKPTDTFTPEQLKKWSNAISEKSNMPVVLVFDSISPYATKKLLMDHVGFVVVGKQISLPFLATYIKNERRVPKKEIRKFSPVTQMIFLYALYSDEAEFTLKKIADELDISDMSATRGMRELTQLGMFDMSIGGVTGRKKVFKRKAKKDFYLIGRDYLESPVTGTVYVKSMPGERILPKADLCALAEQTMLNPPEQMCYALPAKDKGILAGYELTKEQAVDEKLPMIQLTKYDVGIFFRNEYEDPVSLILGLSERDERIEMAVDELMEGIDWYEG